MSVMSDSININDLPVIEELKNGDKLVVESQNEGTRLIDYQNLIFGPDNVTFYTELSTNTTDVASLCSQVAGINTTVNGIVTTNTNINAVSSTLTTSVNTISASVTDLEASINEPLFQTLTLNTNTYNWDVNLGKTARIVLEGSASKVVSITNFIPGERYQLFIYYVTNYATNLLSWSNARIRWLGFDSTSAPAFPSSALSGKIDRIDFTCIPLEDSTMLFAVTCLPVLSAY